MSALIPFRIAAVLLAIQCLASCAPGVGAILDTATSVIGLRGDASGVQLRPDFRYLRVRIDGRTVFLALGYVDPHPLGAIEVWYSANQEVVRLQNGRMVGANGLKREWLSVVVPPLPSWEALAKRGSPIEWVRVRDAMPGHRFGIRETLRLSPVPAPARSALVGRDPGDLVWFEERVDASPAPASNSMVDQDLPAALYAVDPSAPGVPVIYAEQCLARDLCFSWQRWSAEQQAAAAAR